MTVMDALCSSIILSAGYILLGLLIIGIFFFIVIFNGLMSMRNNIDKAWANIDVLLKKRLDLIPSLVEVVRGYMRYEKSVLEEITRIRIEALRAKDISEIARDNEALSKSLDSLFAVAEDYPELKSSRHFLDLQDEISDLETRIAHRREFYNDSVMLYNTRLETIPSRFVASAIRLKPKKYYKVGEEARNPVEINIKSI